MNFEFKKLNIIFLMLSIFLIEFAVYTKNVINITNYSQTIINIALVILSIFTIIKLFIIKIDMTKWFLFLFLIILSLFSLIVTKDSLILQLCLLLINSYGIEFRKIVKYDFIFKLALLVFIYICYKSNNVIIPYFMRNGIVRYSYGFNQPNVFSSFVAVLFFEYIYLTSDSNKLFSKIVAFFTTMIFINTASSRASEIIVILFFVMYLIYYFKNNFKNNNQIKKCNSKRLFLFYLLLFIFLTIISFKITNDFSNGSKYALELDKLLSERLSLQAVFNKIYPITPFGNEVIYFDTLDNAYIRAIVNYGLLSWIAYGVIYSYIILKSSKNKDIIIKSLFCIFLIYGLVEWFILRPSLNIFILYALSKVSKNNIEGVNYEK